MKDKWYADDRDLVKWGSIISIAKDKNISKIIQVAFYEDDFPEIEINVDNKKIAFPQEVWNHFRKLEDIKRLGQTVNITIEVYKKPFLSRVVFFNDLISDLKKEKDRIILFLDPDTGIAPNNDAKFKHVMRSEIEQVYNSLKPNDILVFYQHARRDKDWKENTKKEFKRAINTNEIKTYYSENIVNDVAFFVVKKNLKRDNRNDLY